MTLKVNGQLEIDIDRGVIYFHNVNTGTTLLRICKLKIPEDFTTGGLIDITGDRVQYVRADS